MPCGWFGRCFVPPAPRDELLEGLVGVVGMAEYDKSQTPVWPGVPLLPAMPAGMLLAVAVVVAASALGSKVRGGFRGDSGCMPGVVPSVAAAGNPVTCNWPSPRTIKPPWLSLGDALLPEAWPRPPEEPAMPGLSSLTPWWHKPRLPALLGAADGCLLPVTRGGTASTTPSETAAAAAAGPLLSALFGSGAVLSTTTSSSTPKVRMPMASTCLPEGRRRGCLPTAVVGRTGSGVASGGAVATIEMHADLGDGGG
mmetsp:Transcript_66024/g.167409  ORF Transcript_66024/g.167409 Transcript_66024/m.167409 type:complete len:254 (+) Transcript_66024:117-878(+)